MTSFVSLPGYIMLKIKRGSFFRRFNIKTREVVYGKSASKAADRTHYLR